MDRQCRQSSIWRLLPEIQAEHEEALVVICGEVLLRREANESPTLAEYQRRFPTLAEELALQFEVDRFLSYPLAPSATTDLEDDDTTQMLPGFEILDELGRGASGIVYKARQLSLKRIVAVKILRATRADGRQLARQQREAEALARLRHPHVVHIHEVLKFQGRLHLVMEYVDGPSLGKKTRGQPMIWKEAAQLVGVLAEAMEGVHQAGVLHRDLKPSNILLTRDGQPKIADFGLAKLQDDAGTFTTDDTVLGTPSYMSPEQAVGSAAPATPCCDVYSLGAILYELLTGRPPFLGATVLDTLALVVREEPVAPRRLQPSIPRDLETICLKCLEKSPSRRYATAAELAIEIRRLLDGQSILARPASPVQRVMKWAQRHPAGTGVVALVGLIVLSVAGGAYWHSGQQRRTKAATLVESLVLADTSHVPLLIDRLKDYPKEVSSLLNTASAKTPFGSPGWLHVRLALLPNDSSVAMTLANYVPNSRPEEIQLLANSLGPYANEVEDSLWSVLVNSNGDGGERLYVACVLANLQPVDPRWERVAGPVANELVRSNPLHAVLWTDALRPVNDYLMEPLVSIFRQATRSEPERLLAASVLANHQSERPELLAELSLDATPSQYRVLVTRLVDHHDLLAPGLLATAMQRFDEPLAKLPPGLDSNAAEWVAARSEMVRLARQSAMASITLARLGLPEALCQRLRSGPDPTARAFAIELAAPCGLPVQWFIDQFRGSSDDSVRRACVLAMGQFEEQSLSVSIRSQLSEQFVEVYATHPDAGLRQACRWLLRRWAQDDRVTSIDERLAGQPPASRHWFVNRERQTFVIMNSGEFTMGSLETEDDHEEDEVLQTVRIERPFAISACEVTLKEFRRFRPDAPASSKYSPDSTGPMVSVSWYDAASYCRWLSEQEGIAEDQMCFPALDQIKPDMTLPANYASRTGYRLPTEIEWEYACRAGTVTGWSFGRTSELIPAYAQVILNSSNRAWSVGLLKPSDYGLFDMHGNAAEWCVNPLTEDWSEADLNRSEDRQLGPQLRRTRGGYFGDSPFITRSARRNAQPPDAAWAVTGFRPVRTISDAIDMSTVPIAQP